MTKRTPAKLQLHRETLRRLEDLLLRGVKGVAPPPSDDTNCEVCDQ